jgi:hypothetical protein
VSQKVTILGHWNSRKAKEPGLALVGRRTDEGPPARLLLPGGPGLGGASLALNPAVDGVVATPRHVAISATENHRAAELALLSGIDMNRLLWHEVGSESMPPLP